MAVYVSCAACGWRGTRGMLGDHFATHVCNSANNYRSSHVHLRDGWPGDRETYQRLGENARDAVNPKLPILGP